MGLVIVLGIFGGGYYLLTNPGSIPTIGGGGYSPRPTKGTRGVQVTAGGPSYASGGTGRTWSLATSGVGSIYNSGNRIVANGDGSYSNSGSNVRNEVCTPGFPRNSFGNPDHSILAARGYMWRPDDWRNFEMTGYYQKGGSNCSSGAGQTPHQEHVMGGGVNDGHGCGPVSCQATNYHLNIYPTGRIRLERDLCHNTGYQANAQESTSSALAAAMNSGRWYGYRTTKRTVGNTVVLEAFLDANANGQWQRIFTGVDRGQMGCRGVCCCKGCNCNRPVFWGGPCLSYRYDGMCLKWKGLSAREIA